jgi:polyferredoxin
MTVGYSVITWTAMAAFGRSRWLRYGDPFSVVFALLARFAATELRVRSSCQCRRCESGCEGGPDGCVNCVECFDRAPAAERELNLRPFAAGLFSAQGVSSSVTVFVLLLPVHGDL